MDRLGSRSAACLVSGLLESSHARRPTASNRRVSSPSFVGGQKYCKNIERHLLSILLISETFRNIFHGRRYIHKAHLTFNFRKSQHLSSWSGCWKIRDRKNFHQLSQVERRPSWRDASKGEIRTEISSPITLLTSLPAS